MKEKVRWLDIAVIGLGVMGLPMAQNPRRQRP